MCGRYFIHDDESDMAIEYAISRLDRTFSGDITPGMEAPVISAEMCLLMRWGVKGSKGLMINARSETADSKAMFRQSRTAILPASGFYEWNSHGTRYSCRVHGDNFMAGLIIDSGEGARYVVLTRPAEGALAPIHDRMPLFIPRGLCRTWINGGSAAWDIAHSLTAPEIAVKADMPEQMDMFM